MYTTRVICMEDALRGSGLQTMKNAGVYCLLETRMTGRFADSSNRSPSRSGVGSSNKS